MPFKCELTLTDSIQPNDEIEFVKWLPESWESDCEWGATISHDEPYAIVKNNGVLGKIFTTFPGVLLEKGKLTLGDSINNKTILAIMAAEGDEIAYGKPYSIFRKNT